MCQIVAAAGGQSESKATYRRFAIIEIVIERENLRPIHRAESQEY